MDEPLPLDPTAPVIIVGAGRSGTTRLAATLGAHPDFYMIGETSFLLPRLWNTFFERPAYVRNWRLGQLAQQELPEWKDRLWWEFWNSDSVQRDLSRLEPRLSEIERTEMGRLALVFGRFFAETLIPPGLRVSRWGFKEIWGGSDSMPSDWGLYRAAFPNAVYVHSVRHPIAYLQSVTANNSRTLSSDANIANGLREWVTMVNHARTLKTGDNYVEFRMEDLEDRLPRILGALRLSSDSQCERAVLLTYLPSSPDPIRVSAETVDSVPGLRALAAEFDYGLPT